ncbi:MAG: disulfide bond formation protein B [Rhodospirillales bacterium]
MMQSHRAPLIILAASSAIALGTAYGSQYLAGLNPCVLCLYQRIPHWLVLVAGLLAALPLTPAHLRRPALVFCGLALLAGAAIAGFHHGVEQKWWAGTDDCSAVLNTGSFEDFRAQILNNPIVRCDEVPWSLFGLSMASYNFLASLLLSVVAFWCAAKRLPGGLR